MSPHNLSPLVSIIIPVYNGARYMREAIDSALAQTYRNVEVIVVNDGSMDNGETEAIAYSYGNAIRYFHKENGGCASALNHGLGHMKGEYFSWLSHDDIYYPMKIEHQIKVLLEIDNKDTILYGGYEYIDENSQTTGFAMPEKSFPIDKLNVPLFTLMYSLINGCTLLIPSKLFKEIGVFNESLISTHDYALWFDFFRVAPIHFDSTVLTKYRIHPEQGTNTIKSHFSECEDFWLMVLEKVTDDEMVKMSGSPKMFLNEMKDHFKMISCERPYQLAMDMIRERGLEANADNLMDSSHQEEVSAKSFYSQIVNKFKALAQSLRIFGVRHTANRIFNKLFFRQYKGLVDQKNQASSNDLVILALRKAKKIIVKLIRLVMKALQLKVKSKRSSNE